MVRIGDPKLDLTIPPWLECNTLGESTLSLFDLASVDTKPVHQASSHVLTFLICHQLTHYGALKQIQI